MKKILLALTSFLIALIILLNFAFPLFWQIIGSLIIAMGVFFAFDSGAMHAPVQPDPLDESSEIPADFKTHYLPINEYNKKFGIPSNEIKNRISDGSLKGLCVNRCWYIHVSEMQ